MRVQDVKEMQVKPGDIEGDSESADLSYVFFRFSDEFRTVVVKRALAWRDEASSEARAALRKAVNESPITVAGFRNVDLAPAPRLLEPVTELAQVGSDLAGAVLRLWVESHEELRVLVASHLESYGIPVSQADYSGNLIRLGVFDSVRDDARNSFLEQRPETGEDDLTLMIDYITGVLAADDEFEEYDALSVEAKLTRVYDELSLLSPFAPEWEEVVPEFVQEFIALVELKERARDLAAALDQLLTEIRGRYRELIEFFQWNSRKWNSTNLSLGLGLQPPHDLTAELSELLAQYVLIHERAPVISEELFRAESRAELLPRIVEVGAALDGMMGPGYGADDDAPEPARPPARGPEGGPANPEAPDGDADSPQIQSSADPARLTTDGPDSPDFDGFEGFNEVEPCYIEDYLLLRLGNQDLEQENDELEREVQSLKEQLFESRNRGEGFRLALASQDSGGGEETLEIENVNVAVGLAKEKFGGQLLFQLNSESSVEGNPFKWPDRVWKALEWLATSYYDSRTGATKTPDLDGSCRLASEMWYKTSQHDTTMTTYRNSYTTKVGGRTVWLREHIGKGASLDPRRTIRIAFDWDRGLRRVIIGYIGRHQKTAAS